MTQETKEQGRTEVANAVLKPRLFTPEALELMVLATIGSEANEQGNVFWHFRKRNFYANGLGGLEAKGYVSNLGQHDTVCSYEITPDGRAVLDNLISQYKMLGENRK